MFEKNVPQNSSSASPAIPYYHFSLLNPHSAHLAHAVFTREGGQSKAPFDSLNVRYGIGDPDSSVMKNRQMMQDFFEREFLHNDDPASTSKTRLVSANQTHSDHVFSIHQNEPLEKQLPNMRHEAGDYEVDDVDAFVTDRRDISLLIQVADCQAIILYEPVAGVLGMVHNGWRGSVQNIIGKTIAVMRDEFGADPVKIIAGIGPSIGPCCHYFTDPKSELPEEFHRYILADANNYRVDFLSASRDQLMHAGVIAENIEFSNICTYETTSEFYSYRHEKLTGRFGVMAALR
ncbi:MAG: polyphenol oxidase family protein [Candidatus Gracilibacteria bacterium]